MKLTKLQGYFDCRKYQKGVQRGSRLMVEAGGRINLSVAFSSEDLPSEISEFAKKSDTSGLYYLSFKLFPKNTKCFTAGAKLIDFPSYDKIDGGKFEFNVDFSIKHGTGTELNGCYVNQIQILRRCDNAFAAEEGYDEDVFGCGAGDVFSAPQAPF